MLTCGCKRRRRSVLPRTIQFQRLPPIPERYSLAQSNQTLNSPHSPQSPTELTTPERTARRMTANFSVPLIFSPTRPQFQSPSSPEIFNTQIKCETTIVQTSEFVDPISGSSSHTDDECLVPVVQAADLRRSVHSHAVYWDISSD